MNRRAFLKTSSVLAVTSPLAAQLTTYPGPPKPLPPHTPPVRAGGVNIAVFHAAGTAHAVAIANQFRGNCTAQDLRNAASALSVAHVNWLDADLDHKLIPGFNEVQESWITPARMPIKWITESINSFNPEVTQAQVSAQLQDSFNRSVYNGVDYKTLVLNQCRAGGASQIMVNGIAALNEMASIWIPPQISPITHKYVPQVRPPNGPPPPINPGEGGGGSQCAHAGMAAAALGLAAAVLSVMTDGLDILAAAAWESIAYWGGIGAAGFGLGVNTLCNF